MTFKIVGGQWCNHEPMTHNKLQGSMDMFHMEIFEILQSEIIFGSFLTTFTVYFS